MVQLFLLLLHAVWLPSTIIAAEAICITRPGSDACHVRRAVNVDFLRAPRAVAAQPTTMVKEDATLLTKTGGTAFTAATTSAVTHKDGMLINPYTLQNSILLVRAMQERRAETAAYFIAQAEKTDEKVYPAVAALERRLAEESMHSHAKPHQLKIDEGAYQEQLLLEQEKIKQAAATRADATVLAATVTAQQLFHLQDVGVKEPRIHSIPQMAGENPGIHRSLKQILQNQKSGQSEWIYVPPSSNRPAFIYMSEANGRPSSIYVPTQTEIEDLCINYLNPRMVQCSGHEKCHRTQPVAFAPAAFIASTGGTGSGLGALGALPPPVAAIASGVYIGFVAYQSVPFVKSFFCGIKKRIQDRWAAKEEKNRVVEEEYKKNTKTGCGYSEGACKNDAYAEQSKQHKDQGKNSKPNAKDNKKPGSGAKDGGKGTVEAPKHPHGVYEPSPKHHPNTKPGIGKPPHDGQKALDESLPVPNKGSDKIKQRVTIQDKKIIILKEHLPGKWHAYIEEDINRQGASAAKQVLVEAGIINDKGKILKR